jgi:hypothetical protein
MKVKKIHLASISDIHLGHRLNSTFEIIKNLGCAIGDNAETSQIDLLLLAGDVFDNLLNLSKDEVTEIDFWIASLIRICAKFQIVLRIVEGTPFHDRTQSKRFFVINEIMGNLVDLKYVSTISIEYIEKFGINMLYVPDEASESPEKTLHIVKELMASKGLEQVDFACMHGAFDYQLPIISKDHKHNSAEYLRLVKYLITIGHVHTFSQFDRIFAQGSFDRLAHGEEEAKGFVKATVWQDGEWEVKFVENHGAKKFVTFKSEKDSLEETLADIEQLVYSLPEKSHIRLDLPKGHPLLVGMDTLIRSFPGIFWAKKEQKEDMVEDDLIPDAENEYVPITITKDNIVDMVVTRMGHRDQITGEVLEAATMYLKRIIDERK